MTEDRRRRVELSLTETQSASDQPSSAPADALEAPLPEVEVDRYHMQYEHARGGLGRVLKARDRRLGRVVAVKELLRPDRTAHARFVREARLTARLQHPSIVPVYEAGRFPMGPPFYAMKFVDGQPLKQVVLDTRSFDERLGLLPHVIAVAEAIAYAHNEDIIHRDLKPSNVIVGPFGETMVVDWGLAKDLAAPETRSEIGGGAYREAAEDGTIHGTIVGTPGYMPPEQAAGEPVGKRADVYAIGALLYFVLCKTTPYAGAEPDQIIELVQRAAPAPVIALEPGVPRDLAAIVEKAMARNPGDRYADAGELLQDLKRFHTGQLVGAHHYSSWTLARRWVHRHRAPMSTAALVLLTLVVGGTVSVRRIVRERNRAEERGNALIMAHARAALRSDPTASLAWLKQYPLEAGHWDEARRVALEADSLGVAKHVFLRDESQVPSGAFSHDGRLFASAGSNRTLRVWDVATGHVVAQVSGEAPIFKVVWTSDDHTLVYTEHERRNVFVWRIGEANARKLSGHTSEVWSIAISPDGKQLASGGRDGEVRLWNLAAGEGRTLARVHDVAMMLSFNGDGHSLISTDGSGVVWIWNLDNGASRSLDSKDGEAADAALSSDQTELLLAEQGQMRVWNLATGMTTVRKNNGPTLRIAMLSPDGKQVIFNSNDQRLHLWNIGKNDDEKTIRSPTAVVTDVTFSPQGHLIAIGGADGTILLWNTRDDTRRLLVGHRSRVNGMTFSHDGAYLASASEDRTIRIWPIDPEPERVLRGHLDQVQFVAFSPDGKSIVSAGRDRTVRLWTANEERILGQHGDLVYRAIFSPDGSTVASSSQDGTISIWDVAHHRSQLLTGHRGPVPAIAFSRNGAALVSGGSDGTVRLWNLKTSTARIFHERVADVFAVAISPDMRHVASGEVDGLIHVWNVETGALQVLKGHRNTVYDVAFAPDGKLGSVGADATARIWNLGDGSARVLEGQAGLRRLQFSGDGQMLAAVGYSPIIRLWQLSTFSSIDLVGHKDQVRSISFSPRSNRLVSASFDGTMRLWEIPSGLESHIYRHEGSFLHCVFSPMGDRVAMASDDGTVRVWSTGGIAPPKEEPQSLRQWMSARTTATFAGTDEIPISPDH